MPAILRTGDWLGSGVQSSLTFCANEANFRTNEANGQTIVKTMFGHEQHDARPNEPDLEHFSFRLNLSAVIAGLDPAIHLLTKMDGCAGQART
jgi:hypothetical protein